MMVEKKSLSGFFEDYMNKNSLFSNKKVLQSNYTPNKIQHRDEQINYIAGVLAPLLRMEKPSNLFLYGKTGTGKTLVTKYVTNQILEVANKNNLKLKIIYVNCKLKRVADTEYRVIAQLANEIGVNIPSTGLPTDEVYKLFLQGLDKEKCILVLVLDEIDQLVKKAGDGIIYNLTRLNSELKNVEFSIIGISNDLLFMDEVDPRVKSSLSEEELVFPSYNALQIQDILKQRCSSGFVANSIEEGVIEKCSAYAAREHGDARRALELLRIAGELAERKNKPKVNIGDIDEAEEKIERDKIIDAVHAQPKQFQITLFAILNILERGKSKKIFTGDIYEIYTDLSLKIGIRPLTQRRVSDIIAELDMLGIINARVISKGRYGRTREIKLVVPLSTIPQLKQILKEGLNL